MNVFEVFLPQLLLYPNPSDPLNREAGALMMEDSDAYEQTVKGIDNFWHFTPMNHLQVHQGNKTKQSYGKI